MWRKRTILSLVVLILAIYLYTKLTVKPREGTTVKTKSGQVKGIILESSRNKTEYYAWLGIPYAQPPVGPLRFASPKPVIGWDGVLDGSAHGARCAQRLFILNWEAGEEDCLFLNVYSPKKLYDDRKKLPVIVYIHGGAFVAGSSMDINPDFFMDKNVIVVSLNYRVGILGFLSLGDKNIRGNMGLKDQALALKWIKDNVDSFGGDSNQITIFGTSAGGASVHYQTLSKQSRGLFHRAIAQSGVSILPWAFWTSERAIEKTKSIAKELNCPLNEGNEKLTECLQNLDLHELLSAYKKDSAGLSIAGPGRFGETACPTVELVDDDEAFLTESPYDVITGGKAHRIPLMTGICRDEGLLASASLYNDEEETEFVESNWNKCIQSVFRLPSQSEEKTRKLRHFYFGQEDQSAVDYSDDGLLGNYTNMLGDGLFAVGCSEVADAQKKFSPVHLYYYNKTGGNTMGYMFSEKKNRFHLLIEVGIVVAKYFLNQWVWKEPIKNYGIFHADDMFMLFSLIPGFEFEEGDALYEFSNEYVNLYVSFASDNLETVTFQGIKFQATPTEGPLKYLVIGDNTRMAPEPFAHRTKFWRSINYPQLFSSKKR